MATWACGSSRRLWGPGTCSLPPQAALWLLRRPVPPPARAEVRVRGRSAQARVLGSGGTRGDGPSLWVLTSS